MIVDRWGQPIRRTELVEQQTSPLVWLHSELQAHPSRGLTPGRLAQILDAAETGDWTAQYELFADMEERDAHLSSEMDKRRRAVAQLAWDLVPPDGATPAEVEATALVRGWIRTIPELDQHLFDLTDAIGKGFSAIEHQWHLRGGRWQIQQLHYRPQTWFQACRNGAAGEEIRLRDHSPGGMSLQPAGWTVHRVRARSGWMPRTPLMRALAIPYMLKVYGVGFLAEFCEVYGLPVRIGYYPQGASGEDRATLKRALAHIGRSASGIVPDGMRMEFEDAATGNVDPFAWLIEWCERSVSKLILGATLTSQADGKTSTNALGSIHNEVRLDIRDSDAQSLGATLTRDLVWPLSALSGLFADPARAPRWVFDTGQAEDLKLYAEALPPLVAMGVQVPTEWAHEQLRIPRPKDGQAVLHPAVAPVPPALAAARALPPPRSEPATADARLQAELVDWVERESGKPVDAWIDEIRALVDTAPSLEAIRAGLDELLVDGLPERALGELLAQAMAVGHLAGQQSAREQARA